MSYYGDGNKENLRWEIQDFLSKGYDLTMLMEVVTDCVRDYEVEREEKIKELSEEKDKNKAFATFLDRYLTDLVENCSEQFREKHKDLFDKLEGKE